MTRALPLFLCFSASLFACGSTEVPNKKPPPAPIPELMPLPAFSKALLDDIPAGAILALHVKDPDALVDVAAKLLAGFLPKETLDTFSAKTQSSLGVAFPSAKFLESALGVDCAKGVSAYVDLSLQIESDTKDVQKSPIVISFTLSSPEKLAKAMQALRAESPELSSDTAEAAGYKIEYLYSDLTAAPSALRAVLFVKDERAKLFLFRSGSPVERDVLQPLLLNYVQNPSPASLSGDPLVQELATRSSPESAIFAYLSFTSLQTYLPDTLTNKEILDGFVDVFPGVAMSLDASPKSLRGSLTAKLRLPSMKSSLTPTQEAPLYNQLIPARMQVFYRSSLNLRGLKELFLEINTDDFASAQESLDAANALSTIYAGMPLEDLLGTFSGHTAYALDLSTMEKTSLPAMAYLLHVSNTASADKLLGALGQLLKLAQEDFSGAKLYTMSAPERGFSVSAIRCGDVIIVTLGEALAKEICENTKKTSNTFLKDSDGALAKAMISAPAAGGLILRLGDLFKMIPRSAISSEGQAKAAEFLGGLGSFTVLTDYNESTKLFSAPFSLSF